MRHSRRSPWRPGSLATILVIALLAGACAGPPSTSSPPSGASPASHGTATPTQAGAVPATSTQPAEPEPASTAVPVHASSPAATHQPAGPRSSATPAPVASEEQSTPIPAPSPTLTPPGVLQPVYAALRPLHLRTVTNPATLTRGAPVLLAFELTNVTSTTVVVPRTQAAAGQGPWLGLVQTWIEPLERGRSLAACLPALARRGARYATGGSPVAMITQGVGQPFGPGAGLTQYRIIPGEWTACFPSGRYRYRVEYKELDASPDRVLASATLDFVLREPTSWRADVRLGAVTGSTTVARTSDATRVTGVLELRGLEAGGTVTVTVRAGGCAAPGPAVGAPIRLDGSGSGADRRTVTLRLGRAARAAIDRGQGLAAWLADAGSTGCVVAKAQPLADPQRRAPTAWGGPQLQARARGGLVVTASSEIVGGRLDQAVDGRDWLTWNAGGWPQTPGGRWIEVDLGRDTPVTGVDLLPSQLPDLGVTVHRVYGRVDGGRTEVLLGELAGATSDNVWISSRFASRRVRYVRIATVSGPSWVAWREVVVLGPTLPPRSLAPDGTHDGIDATVATGARCRAEGWANDPDDRGRTVTVRVLVDGKQAWQTPADLYRADLAAAGFGSGFAGFSIPLANLLSPGVGHEIRVQAFDVETGRWSDLVATPRTLWCA